MNDQFDIIITNKGAVEAEAMPLNQQYFNENILIEGAGRENLIKFFRQNHDKAFDMYETVIAVKFDQGINEQEYLNFFENNDCKIITEDPSGTIVTVPVKFEAQRDKWESFSLVLHYRLDAFSHFRLKTPAKSVVTISLFGKLRE